MKYWIVACLVCLAGLGMINWSFAHANPPVQADGPVIGGCLVFPANNIWNRTVTDLPVHAQSNAYIQSIGAATGLHPDFGSGLWDGGKIGIPYNLVTGSQAKTPVEFDYADESDAGPYPIPDTPLTEAGSDQHVLVVDTSACVLYELYLVRPPSGGLGWQAGSGAIFDLKSNALRPDTWTSADAAGLPILAGLARYEEVAAGKITHALRFTVDRSQRAYVWPARHYASWDTSSDLPPMGMRFRLKAGFDTSGFPPQARVVLNALKEYGMIVADNGSSWYITGAPDDRWDNDDLHTLSAVTGENFEAVEENWLRVDPNSARFWQPSGTPRAWLPLVRR